MAKNFRAEKLTGTAGELFTAFELTMLGVSCDLVKQDGTDLIAIKGHGLPIALRVEVKTSTHTNEKYKKNKAGIGVGKQYSFTTSKGSPKRAYTKEDCDILALVCLPLRKIQFLPVGMVRGITKRIHKDTFNDDNITEKSWRFAVERCLYESSRAIQQREANLPLPIPLHFEKAV
tara:strand:- start:747 stop:1271 length:525 start_codon:yes stop_codon:yes gene_type:complete